MNNIVKETKYLIVGAGCGGLQTAYFLEKAKQSYVVVDAADHVGSFWDQYPRHGLLISINKVFTGSDDKEYNMRHDWNSLVNEEDVLFKDQTFDLFPNVKHLRNYLFEFAKKIPMNIDLSTTVKKIYRETTKDSQLFTVHTNKGIYKAEYVFMSLGAVEPYIPKIKGIEHSSNYSNHDLNLDSYNNKRVLIIGKGNSAFETADYIAGRAAVIHMISPHKVKMAWNTHYVGHLRAINNNFLDMYQLKSQHGIMNGNISEIRKREDGNGYQVDFDFTITPEDPMVSFQYDKVICCTGWKFIKPELFDEKSCPIELAHDGKYAKMDQMYQSVSSPGMFFVGVHMGGKNLKSDTSGFIHGFRYCIAGLMNQLLNMHSPKSYSLVKKSVSVDVESITKHISNRVCNVASMYQMFGVICDVFPLSKLEDEKESFYYYDLLRDSYKQLDIFKDRLLVKVSLEFGSRGGVDAFVFNQTSTPSHPEKSWSLHPVIQIINEKGIVIDELHMLEEIEFKFNHPKYHLAPMKKFFEKWVKLSKSGDYGHMTQVKPIGPLASITIKYN